MGIVRDNTTFGLKSRVITPGSSDIPDPVPKAVVVTSITNGDVLEVLPANNADGSFITFDGVSVGFSPPFVIRRVGVNTTCDVATIED